MMKLKTHKGSTIARCKKYGVGKLIGGRLYLHKAYMEEVVPHDILENAINEIPAGFYFNTLVWDTRNDTIRFDSAENFDTAREPTAGEYISVPTSGFMSFSGPARIRYGATEQVWHHKWLWVKDDYKGFDVRESFEWSKLWLSKLTEAPQSYHDAWIHQLRWAGLE